MAEPDPTPLTAPWREPVRGGHPDGGTSAASGLEQLRTAMTGGGPEPPLGRFTGMRLTAVGDGTASFRMPVTEWWRGTTRAVELGVIAIPADAAMACAIMTRVPAHRTFTTSELVLRVIAEPAVGGELTAEAHVVSAGPSLMLAETTVRDRAGTVVARGSSSCFVMAVSGSLPEPPTYPPAGDGPDPWERTVPPDCERPPLHLMTGIAIERLAGGAAELTLPATPWFCAPPPGRVQGGVITLLCDAAQAVAIADELPAGAALSPVELKINFLRPLASDGARARCRARVAHAGRRTAVAASEVTDARGRTIAIATGSGLVSAAG